ncbi:hypothetical protein D3C85_1152380 [compost metagenome]
MVNRRIQVGWEQDSDSVILGRVIDLGLDVQPSAFMFQAEYRTKSDCYGIAASLRLSLRIINQGPLLLIQLGIGGRRDLPLVLNFYFGTVGGILQNGDVCPESLGRQRLLPLRLFVHIFVPDISGILVHSQILVDLATCLVPQCKRTVCGNFNLKQSILQYAISLDQGIRLSI